MKQLPVLGLMLGDATGIGPEICAKALASGELKSVARIVVIGDVRVLEMGCRDAGLSVAWRRYRSVTDIDWGLDEIPVVDLGNLDPARIERGRLSAESGRVAGATLQYMIELAMEGVLDGIVFAPLNKAALHQGGWKYPDEHQMFAALTAHAGFFGEMNVISEFATFRVTSHVALRKAIELINPERITAAILLADQTLRAAGVSHPRIGVAALNPHCGEGGLFGDEEIRIIRPTVEAQRAAGVNCSGPISSDVIFLKAMKGEFDGVVMMYHDQGQIATKLLGFNRGITVTAGLRTVFATPAHGTAFDIVGSGRADSNALKQAARMAARIAAARECYS